MNDLISKMISMNTRNTVVGLLGVAALTCAAHAQDNYPTRPVTVVVAFSAGAISDLVTRIVAEKMREELGQSIVVENRAGVGGIVGASYVAKAKPDGYTILLGSNSTNAINQSLYRSLPYKPDTDFVPVSLAGEIPAVLIAKNSFPANTAAELVKHASARPGTVSYAVGNTTSRVGAEAMKKATGADWVVVPYKSEPPGLNDLLGGQVDVMSLNLPVAYQYIKSGQIKALGLMGPDRVAALPDVAPLKDSINGFAMPNGWLGFYAPAATPAAIVTRLNKAIVAAFNDPGIRKRLEATGGYIAKSSTPGELAQRTKADAAKWAELITASGIALE